jgi:hypothetical protein
MKRTLNTFQTVKTEGAILPIELLRRILDGDRDIPGLRPEDYHLAKSERLNEAATRAWNRLQGAWQGFKDAMEVLPESDAGTSLTRERWLLIFFQELGYGRLTTRKAYEIEGRTYPISHEWQNTPIHLVSFRLDLDKRTPGRAGAARVSPHSLVQELINRSDDHLWGFVSDGLSLRLLRDNVSLTRQAYVEFDLQAMMDSEAYSDFFLLFLLCHQSRVEIPEDKTPEHCWLEKWYNIAAQQGVRALDQLRDGVQRAIEALGGGFLAYPGNAMLREKLRSGELSTQDYYRQVLRQVYRLLFLFVAEDRELLSDPSAPAGAGKLYLEHYSTLRLRSLAGKTRGTRHPDLWRALRLVFDRLHEGCPELALPALGSYLFSAGVTADLNGQDIANADLLKAFRALTFTVARNVLRPINYRNLGPEELGSVYESLLEMHPAIHMEASNPEDRFKLSTAAGSERKTTGSYYTPSSLVNCLLDSALEPVLNEAIRKPDQEKALFELKICDPACGSGHFLIAAAHRIAKRLAAIRAGEDEPAPEHYQHALRDVIGRCIYGVDINPMSVELCKVSLWMEAMEPGKPLAFLDHHIKCGNSLLGSTPALLKKGIPDDAFKPIEGDDNDFCREYKQRNRRERRGSHWLFAPDGMPWEQLGDLGPAMMEIDGFDDSTLAGLRRKEEAYSRFVLSNGYLFGKLLYDAWCAAFVWGKRRSDELPYPITQEILHRIRRNPHGCPPWMREEIIRLAQEYRFFHWHLEFPDVFQPKPSSELQEDEVTGWTGGFDCVLGNPPWEASDLVEKEFFAVRAPAIATARTKARRVALIAALHETDPALANEWSQKNRSHGGESHLAKDSGLFPLGSGGKLNTYRLFSELATAIINPDGRMGMVLKSGIINAQDSQPYFGTLLKERRICDVIEFINTEMLFPDIVANERFCMLTVCGRRGTDTPARYVFGLTSPNQIGSTECGFSITVEELKLINPNDLSVPPLLSPRDKALLLHIHRSCPALLIEEEGGTRNNLWRVKYAQGHLNSASGSTLFAEHTLEQLLALGAQWGDRCELHLKDDSFLPLYEGKFIAQMNHRFGTFEGVAVDRRFGTKAEARNPSRQQLEDPDYEVMPRYWLRESDAKALYKQKGTLLPWLFSFRDVCRAIVDARTVQACLLPLRPCLDGCPLLVFESEAAEAAHTGLFFNSMWASFIFDYAARQKIHGAHLTKAIAYQLPVPEPGRLYGQSETVWAFMRIRSLELTCVTSSFSDLALLCGYDGPPFIWDEERRFMIRCELDASFFHFYLGSEQEWQEKGSKELLSYFPTPRHAVEYIMDTFRIIRERDEAKYDGDYRTKRVIMEVYDTMAEAIRIGQPYQTRLDPLPGPPMDAAGNFIPMDQWDRDNWPSHIHPPKEEAAVERPEEVPLEEFAAMAYPASDMDKAICAAALAIVEQSRGLSSADHLDALLLATHPDWCQVFLDQSEHRAFEATRKSAPPNLVAGVNQSIQWKDCRDYLEKQQAIAVNRKDQRQTISPGTNLTSARKDLPGGVDEIVRFALQAMKRVAELRKDLSSVPQEQVRIIQVFEEQHRFYQLAA